MRLRLLGLLALAARETFRYEPTYKSGYGHFGIRLNYRREIGDLDGRQKNCGAFHGYASIRVVILMEALV
jgi:hypothetical protein